MKSIIKFLRVLAITFVCNDTRAQNNLQFSKVVYFRFSCPGGTGTSAGCSIDSVITIATNKVWKIESLGTGEDVNNNTYIFLDGVMIQNTYTVTPYHFCSPLPIWINSGTHTITFAYSVSSCGGCGWPPESGFISAIEYNIVP